MSTNLNHIIAQIQNLPQYERNQALAGILAGGPKEPQAPKVLNDAEKSAIADLRKEILGWCIDPFANEAKIAANVAAIRRMEGQPLL